MPPVPSDSSPIIENIQDTTNTPYMESRTIRHGSASLLERSTMVAYNPTTQSVSTTPVTDHRRSDHSPRTNGLPSPVQHTADSTLDDDCSQVSAIDDFIISGTTERHVSRRDQDITRWRQHLISTGKAEAGETLRSYLLEVIFPKTTSADVIQRVVSAIDFDRRRRNLPAFQEERRMDLFMQAVRRNFLKGKKYLSDLQQHWSPVTLIHHIWEKYDDQSSKAIRIRTYAGLKLACGMRAEDICSIRRSSIQQTTDMLNRPVVQFQYRGKTAKNKNLSHETNYLEVHPELVNDPAGELLKLKTLMDQLNIRSDDICLNLSKQSVPISASTINTLLKREMLEAGISSNFGAHSTRTMVSEYAALRNIPHRDIDIRFGWSTTETRNTRDFHYRSRCIPSDLVQLLWSGASNTFSPSTVVDEE
jgi:integrase